MKRAKITPMPIWKVGEKFSVRVAHNDDSRRATAVQVHADYGYPINFVAPGGSRTRYEVVSW